MAEPATLETDYLVVGAGAMGMAFVDALVGHADVDVVMIDRRPAPGGHWLDAYPFVRLHQPSRYYGVDSLDLGDGRGDVDDPGAGFTARASAGEICGYYDAVAARGCGDSGRVRFFPMSEHVGGSAFRSRAHRCGHRGRGAASGGRRHDARGRGAGDHAAALRRRRRRALRTRGRARRDPRAARRLRGDRRRQDGDRCARLVARLWCRAGAPSLDPAPRLLAAQPRLVPGGPRPDARRHGRDVGEHGRRALGRRGVRADGAGGDGPPHPPGDRAHDDAGRDDQRARARATAAGPRGRTDGLRGTHRA